MLCAIIYQVMFFFLKILVYYQNSSLKGFHNILSDIQHDSRPETQLNNSCHTRNQISVKYRPFFNSLENLFSFIRTTNTIAGSNYCFLVLSLIQKKVLFKPCHKRNHIKVMCVTFSRRSVMSTSHCFFLFLCLLVNYFYSDMALVLPLMVFVWN